MTDVAAPLVATADEQILDDALRWCAAVGAIPDLAHDVTSARRVWRQASVVIVGEDLAEPLSRAELTRRDHVAIVAHEPAAWWATAVGLGATAVCSVRDEERVLEVLAAALDGRDEGCVVSIVGGSGGVGASTLAVALALAARRRGLRPLLFDADPLGGGLELVLGAERAEGLRWHDLGTTRGRLSAGSLADVLPVHHGVSVLSWTRGSRSPLPDSVPSVLTAAVRGFDLLVADVPRHLDAHGVDIAGRSLLTLLVVAEEIAAVSAARQVLARVREVSPAVALVTVSRQGGIGHLAVADALEVPVLVRHRHDRRIRGAVDRGLGPGRSRSARRTSGVVLDTLGLVAP